MSKLQVDTSSGVEMDAVIAMIISWTTFKSFWWMVLHGIFGWAYVIYYFLIANHDQLLG